MTFDIKSPEMDLQQFGLDGESTIAAQLHDPEFNGCISDYSGAPIEMAKRLLSLASGFSDAPISGFHVGAVAVGQSGKLYLGTNMEFLGVPLSSSLHAEQSAVLNAWYQGEERIKGLVVSASPCGHCRQFLCELPNAFEMQVLFEDKVYDLATLLPDAFGPGRSLGHRLLDSSAYGLESIRPIDCELAKQAIVAAKCSYAPYTQAPEGVALECVDGNVFSGRTAESIAFNPTIPAIVSALNQRNFSHSRKDAITRVAHAKLATSLGAQLDLTKSVMKRISNLKIQSIALEMV